MKDDIFGYEVLDSEILRKIAQAEEDGLLDDDDEEEFEFDGYEAHGTDAVCELKYMNAMACIDGSLGELQIDEARTLILESVPGANRKRDETEYILHLAKYQDRAKRERARGGILSVIRFIRELYLECDASDEAIAKTAYDWVKDLEYTCDWAVYKTLGICCCKGICVEEDENKALEYFKKGLNAGDLTCGLNIADMYMNSKTLEHDEEKYFSIIKDMAQKGCIRAYYYLAKCYHEGIGTEKNDDMAKKAWEKW